MTYKIDYWDTEAGCQKTRDATPEETAEIEARRTAPPEVPASVTMKQARLALLQEGYLSQVTSAISSMSDPQRTEAQIAWDTSPTVLRIDPWVAALGTAIGLTSDQIDHLFILAASL